MIDTVKFRIPITERGFEVLLEKSKIHTGYNFVTKQREYTIIKVPINIGSFSRERTLRIPNDFVEGGSNFAELELSIPKYVYGHNVSLITVEQFNSACKDIERDLREIVGIETDTLSWIIQKIDFCYSWKLNSQDELNTYLKIFQNLDYSRKTTYRYGTSVMYVGSAYSVKSYSKYEEYLKHDLKELGKLNPMLAYEVRELATNVLRFEVSLKKQQFQTVFGKQTPHIADITEETIVSYLNSYLTKLLKITNTKISKNDGIYKKLISEYGEVRGRDMFEKYRLWSSSDPTDKEAFKSYSYPNRYKFIKALNKAGVSLIGDTDFDFKLTIP